MLRLTETESRPTVVASAILALALLGDSLLYATLPLHASVFGISLAWSGMLLSVNRITRLFAYPLLAGVAALLRLRRFTFAAATVGAVSTLAFSVASGPWTLIAARVAWGLAFGSLSLSALAYATTKQEGAGVRIGLSLALRETGPLLSLTAGVALVSAFGIRETLGVLGLISLAALPLARLLPDHKVRATIAPVRDHSSFRLTGHESLSALIGLVADGVFPATIALMLASSGGLTAAAFTSGAILGLKRVSTIVLSPLAGRAADRFGTAATTCAGATAVACGALLLGSGSLAAGSLLLMAGAAATSTSIPLAVTLSGETRVAALARIGLARDAGAAAGPLAAMALFELTGASLIYMACAGLLLLRLGDEWIPPAFVLK